MTDDDWTRLEVPATRVDDWRALDVDAFTAALAQADGYGPSSARHHLGRLRAIADDWRHAGVGEVEAVSWHRAGFSAREAAQWSDRGASVDEAALVTGRRMAG